MSTLSIQRSSTNIHAVFDADDLDQSLEFDSPIDHLVAVSHIRPSDHVVVIGRRPTEYLARLVRCACLSATGVDPAVLYLRKEPADIVWLTEIDDLEAATMVEVLKVHGVRVVAVELINSAAIAKLQPFLRRLRAKGLVRTSCRQVADRLVVTASRPEWLQWVA